MYVTINLAFVIATLKNRDAGCCPRNFSLFFCRRKVIKGFFGVTLTFPKFKVIKLGVGIQKLY